MKIEVVSRSLRLRHRARAYGKWERGLVPRFEQPPWIPNDEQRGAFPKVVLCEDDCRIRDENATDNVR